MCFFLTYFFFSLDAVETLPIFPFRSIALNKFKTNLYSKTNNRWEQETFYDAKKMQDEFSEANRPEAATMEPTKRREKIKEQAEKLQSGTETWTPTWKALGLGFDRPTLGAKEMDKGNPSSEPKE